MTSLSLILILISALIHASWNLLAKRAAGGAAFVWLFCALSATIYLPLAIGAVLIQKPHFGLWQWVFIAGTIIFHTIYFLSLQRGYQMGDLSLVYPLARGTGPLLSTFAAILFLGERPTPLAILGAVLVVACVFVMAGGGFKLAVDNPKVGWALRYGLLTGSIIACYTLWDKQAVTVLAIPPLLLNWSNDLGRTLVLAPVAIRRWDEVKFYWGRHRFEALGIAILSPLSYILVLIAMQTTPVSYVAPAREISILVGAILGAKFLAEGDVKRRLMAASGMVLGVIALALG